MSSNKSGEWVFSRFQKQSIYMMLFILSITILNGLFAAWVTLPFELMILNLDITIWTFLLTWAASIGYFVYTTTLVEVLGLSLYFLGGVIIVKPLLLFISVIETPRAVEDTGRQMMLATQTGAVFLWILVAVVIAGVFILVGRYFRNQAEQSELRQARRRFREFQE